MAKKEPKIRICAKCGVRMPATMRINGVRKILSSRKYCLECSPYKYHNTKQLEITEREASPLPDSKYCPSCKITKPICAFYKKGPRRPHASYCKSCANYMAQQRQVKAKQKAVEYKGGACQKCEYASSTEALEFHHRDQKEKEIGISKLRSASWGRVVKELDKCDLLCINCHREEHAQQLSPLVAVLCTSGDVRVCVKCDISQNTDDFYKSRNGGVLRSWCKVCVKNDGRRRKNEAKQQHVAYKGGACIQCGYAKCLGALEFHHRDPKEKEIKIGDMFSFTEKIKEELDKCDLLCGNCHREEHARLDAKAQLESQAS